MDLTLVVPDEAGVAPSVPPGISWESQPRLRDATGEYVLAVARGQQLHSHLFEKLWSRRKEAEVVLGSRYLPGGGTDLSALASLATRFANRALRRALRLPCHDLTSGVRLYERRALQELADEVLDRSPSLELVVRLYNLGFKLREAPYRDRGDRGLGDVLREAAAAFRELPRLAKLRRSSDAADIDDSVFVSSPPWRRRRVGERLRTIVSFLEVDVPVLDVGCGSSRLIQSLARGTGLDRDRKKLRFLRGRARHLVRGALPRLPFRDGSFPQVVCSDVGPSTSYLPELRRVLTSRGTLVLAPGAARPSEADARAELQRNGFAVDDVRKIRGGELILRAVRV